MEARYKPLNEDQQRLAESCLLWAYKLARPYIAKAPWLRDEIESAAIWGLVTGASKFDPKRAKFTTYVAFTIRGAIAELFRQETYRLRTVASNEATEHAVASAPSRELAPDDAAMVRERMSRPIAPPCKRCGTTEGLVPPGGTAPARQRGYCLDCHKPLSDYALKRNLARKAATVAAWAATCPRCGRGAGAPKKRGLCVPCHGQANPRARATTTIAPCVICATATPNNRKGMCRRCHDAEWRLKRQEACDVIDHDRLASRVRRRARTALAREQGWKCAYCRLPMDKSVGGATRPRGVTLDHRVPRSLGGSDDPSNLAACCYRCNQAKGDLRAGELEEGAA